MHDLGKSLYADVLYSNAGERDIVTLKKQKVWGIVKVDEIQCWETGK